MYAFILPNCAQTSTSLVTNPPESQFTLFQTHSKRSLRSSSKSHSKKRQGGSDLIDTEVNTRDLSHLSFTRQPPRITSAVKEQLSKVPYPCCLLLFLGTDLALNCCHKPWYLASLPAFWQSYIMQ